MEVSPKALREVEFREKMRGYHPEDVDQFLEQVAAGIEVLQDRLRQAVDRAQRAEAAAAEAGGTDDTLRKTLVLAQRTADLAVQEAREQAARILASAEQQAQAILAEAEERGRETLEDTIAECKAELSRLESTRAQAQQDVESLQRWLDEHKAHLHASLSEAVAAVERIGVLWPAPSTRPLDTGRSPVGTTPSMLPPSVVAPSVVAPTVADPNGPGVSIGSVTPMSPGTGPEQLEPETLMWAPGEVERISAGEGPSGYEAGSGQEQMSLPPQARAESGAPASGLGSDEQALDDFFDDNDEFGDERRFGGRLRRRR
jgi:cell division initiation protein